LITVFFNVLDFREVQFAPPEEGSAASVSGGARDPADVLLRVQIEEFAHGRMIEQTEEIEQVLDVLVRVRAEVLVTDGSTNSNNIFVVKILWENLLDY
jgi:hypothetical protein